MNDRDPNQKEIKGNKAKYNRHHVIMLGERIREKKGEEMNT